MILGIVIMVLLLIMISKFVTKRLKWKRADQILLKVHKIIGLIIILVAAIHMIMSFKLFETRPISIYILGIMSLISMIVVAVSYIFRRQLGSKWLIIHRTGTVFIFVMVSSHIIMVMNSLSVYQKEVNNIEINDLEIMNVSNGIYEGQCDVGYILAKVKVTVQSGKIIDISILEHRNERGTPAEVITDQIIEEQKVNVDAISGATNSSKVIEKAVENALKRQLKMH